MANREFIYDIDKQKGNVPYMKLLEKYDYDFETVTGNVQLNDIEKKLLGIIKVDPDFIPAYMELWQFYEQFKGREKEAATYLEIAYRIALDLVRDGKKKFPSVMEWGYIENRSVIRALLNGAVKRWDNGHTEEALHVLRGILKSNPNDNPGVRYLLLAILEGMTYTQYATRFEKGDYMDKSIWPWFEEKSKQHPEDFKWWENAMKKFN